MDFDQLLHSLMVAKGPARSRRWWGRPTTIGAAAIVALSATTAGAVTSNQSAVAPAHHATKTYTASAWPDLLPPIQSAVVPAPPATSAPTSAPAGPVVGAVNLCTGGSQNPAPALMAFHPATGTASGNTVVLTDVAVPQGSSTLNSLLPTIAGAVANATNALGLPLPTLPSSPLPTTTVPSGSPPNVGGGGGGTGTGGTTNTTSPSTTTTPPPSDSAPPANIPPSPLSPSVDPNVGSNDANIGCDLIGSGTVGGMAPGETAAESSAVSNAIALLGTPYQWGGESTQGGFDCSGMVQYVYREVGIFLPRVAQDQYDFGPSVPPGATVEPGDLVFFGSGANDVSHVGMYVGDGLMIDAPHTGAVIRFDRVSGFEPIVGVTSPGQG